MKIKHIFYTIAALVTAMSFQSCTLDEDTSGLSSPDDFFRKYSECQSVVNGCYIPIKSIYTYTYMLATECVSDLAYCPSGTLDAQLDISPATPRHGEVVWKQGYLGVQRCNFAIAGIEDAYEREVISTEQYTQLLCEAKVLRAFYYWTLTSFFGNVPFYFDDVTDNAVLDRIQVLPRMDANETRKIVIDDLMTIVPIAPQTRTSENQGARLGAACGWMLIAQMAMWNGDNIKNGEGTPAIAGTDWWDVALEALGKLEEIYGPLSQYDFKENAMFRNKNTPESIMEIQHVYEFGGLNYSSTVASICMPYPRTTNTAIYNGVEIPELGDQATVWAAMRPNAYFAQALQTKMGKDTRNKVNLAWDYDGKAFTTVWMGPKFWCPNLQGTADGNNYKLFRYARAILMMAECYYEKGDYETAIEYLNMTRTRANMDPYVFRTDVRLYEEIRNEYGRELIGEFNRKFDLVRWGIWYEAVTSRTDYASLKLETPTAKIRPCHRFYPIPETQVVYSKYNLDNNEYAKYGL